MRGFWRWCLQKMGWKLLLPKENPPSSVIAVAPHTSNWDFFLGQLYYQAVGRKAYFLMKKDFFFFPLGLLLTAMGGIPVDRSKKNDLVEKIKKLIKSKKEVHIAITPEGTRGRVERWRTGFLRIALSAEIPIQLAKIDYKRKEVGIFALYTPSGDIELDIQRIASHYSADMARYPELYQAPTNQ